MTRIIVEFLEYNPITKITICLEKTNKLKKSKTHPFS